MCFTVLLMMFTVMAASGEGEYYLSNADIFLLDVTIYCLVWYQGFI